MKTARLSLAGEIALLAKALSEVESRADFADKGGVVAVIFADGSGHFETLDDRKTLVSFDSQGEVVDYCNAPEQRRLQIEKQKADTVAAEEHEWARFEAGMHQ